MRFSSWFCFCWLCNWYFFCNSMLIFIYGELGSGIRDDKVYKIESINSKNRESRKLNFQYLHFVNKIGIVAQSLMALTTADIFFFYEVRIILSWILNSCKKGEKFNKPNNRKQESMWGEKKKWKIALYKSNFSDEIPLMSESEENTAKFGRMKDDKIKFK